jgi:pyruvate dehydrogenase E2 component (dihydrolipoamide acetyltransferase)
VRAGDNIDAFVAGTNRNALKAPVTKLFADPALVTRQLVEDLVKYKRLEGVQEALTKIAALNFEGGVQRRVLVIWGDADQIIPARHAEGLAEGVRVEVIAGKGHMV